MKQKIVFLEWIRGLAAVMVAVTHHLAATVPEFNHFTRNYIDFGRVGVVAFFLVSGYVISLSLRNGDVRSFLIKRMFRLYPIYILVLTSALVLKFRDADWTNGAWIFEVFTNYTMLQELIGFVALLGPAWTLSIEWLFYMQQISAKLLKFLEKAWRLGYVWLAVFVLCNIVESLMGRDLPGSVPMLLSVSCLGHAAFMAHNSLIPKTSFVRLCVASIIVVPTASYIGLDKGGEWPAFVYSTSYLAGLLFFACAFYFRNAKGPKFLPWLGSISYSMYLLPPVVMGIINDAVGDALWLGIILGIVFLPLFAWLAYRFIERPCNTFGHNLAKRYSKPPRDVVRLDARPRQARR
ncbi:acyltransferase family protein [Arthrobacter sp. 3Tela_A]|uniref:acyltransferase family protein n=1 Tax=Arthrobacter sp. 3Tela_A TaxID=3093743 RepID=UPI003BB50845